MLEGIVKHETEYDRTDVLEFDGNLRGHLEAQITNVADELAYTSHDLDDGLRSGMITTEMLTDVELWNRIVDKIGVNSYQLDDLTRHGMIRELIGLEVDSMINASSERLEKSGVNTTHDLQSLPYNVVGFDEDMQQQNRVLKDFLFHNMYRNYRVVRMQKKAERVLSELFTAYLHEPSMLPVHFQELIERKGKEQTICDYLAGMTDRFAVDEYQKLFDPLLLP